MDVIIIYIMVLFIILNTIYVKNYKFFRNLKYKTEIKKEGNELQRELDAIYSPSIVSYLYNQRIEPEKDLIADILNLYARKIINILDNSNAGYILELNQEIYKEKYLQNELFENDRYIIDTIILKRFDFKYEEWLKKIINVYREKINTKEEKKRKNKNNIDKISSVEEYYRYNKKENIKLLGLMYGIIVIFIVLAILFMKTIRTEVFVYFEYAIFAIIIFGALIYILKSIRSRDENKDMHLNKYAKEELKKWMRIEKFIRENTMLKERKFEEIVIFEQYIPFAMVLNINKEYKKEIIKIFGKNEVKVFIESVEKYKAVNNVFIDYYGGGK